ncbi:MAG: hypothetical protein SW833_19775 [Cyanobacteriota bacterium]|nr:hypothetical protein [Cyanobacteriota bacterium]
MSDSDALYKSRLLNFLNRQAMRGRDRAAKTARMLQVAVLWSAQILVYPVYLLVQSGRALGRQIAGKRDRNTSKDSLPPESEPLAELPSDAPIVRVLAIGIQLSGREATGELTKHQPPDSTEIARSQAQLPTAPQPQVGIEIRAIASDVATRKLVLVGSNNRIFDLLSPEQDAQLQRRIIWEIANLNRDRKVLQETLLALRVPSDAARDDRVLLPARWFWRTMGWVQQGTVARAIDLFGESIWVQSFPEDATIDLELPLHLPEALSLPSLSTFVDPLDRAIARAETQLATVPMEGIKETFPFLRRLERAPSTLPLQNFPPFVFLEAQFHPLPGDSRATVQALIRGAIDYFFSDRQQESMPPAPDTAEVLPPSVTGADATEGDLWLSWEDLYNRESTDVFWDSSPKMRPLAALPSAASAPHRDRSPRFRPRSPSFPPPKRDRARIRPAPSSSPVEGVSEATSPAIATTPSTSASPIAEDPLTDWLDIDADPVGYVKHPLEQILEWLDRLMLECEELLLAVWRWIYRRIP